mmetsp:Transcript_28534/g.53875  ORF Transcript_28534/g.53875 Transcript_28534/m.53875 type:complete len:308 (+) Transcript_28534:213-1136(+)
MLGLARNRVQAPVPATLRRRAASSGGCSIRVGEARRFVKRDGRKQRRRLVRVGRALAGRMLGLWEREVVLFRDQGCGRGGAGRRRLLLRYRVKRLSSQLHLLLQDSGEKQPPTGSVEARKGGSIRLVLGVALPAFALRFRVLLRVLLCILKLGSLRCRHIASLHHGFVVKEHGPELVLQGMCPSQNPGHSVLKRRRPSLRQHLHPLGGQRGEQGLLGDPKEALVHLGIHAQVSCVSHNLLLSDSVVVRAGSSRRLCAGIRFGESFFVRIQAGRIRARNIAAFARKRLEARLLGHVLPLLVLRLHERS